MPIKNLENVEGYSEVILKACGEAFLAVIEYKIPAKIAFDAFYLEVGRYFLNKAQGVNYTLNKNIVEAYYRLFEKSKNSSKSFVKDCKAAQSGPSYPSLFNYQSYAGIIVNNPIPAPTINELLDAQFNIVSNNDDYSTQRIQDVLNTAFDFIDENIINEMGANVRSHIDLEDSEELANLLNQVNAFILVKKHKETVQFSPTIITLDLLTPPFADTTESSLVDFRKAGVILLNELIRIQRLTIDEQLDWVSKYRNCETLESIQSCNETLISHYFFSYGKETLTKSRNFIDKSKKAIAEHKVLIFNLVKEYRDENYSDTAKDQHSHLQNSIKQNIEVIQNTYKSFHSLLVDLKKSLEVIRSLDTVASSGLAVLLARFEDQAKKISNQQKQGEQLLHYLLLINHLILHPPSVDVAAILQKYRIKLLKLEETLGHIKESYKTNCESLTAGINLEAKSFYTIADHLQDPLAEFDLHFLKATHQSFALKLAQYEIVKAELILCVDTLKDIILSAQRYSAELSLSSYNQAPALILILADLRHSITLYEDELEDWQEKLKGLNNYQKAVLQVADTLKKMIENHESKGLSKTDVQSPLFSTKQKHSAVDYPWLQQKIADFTFSHAANNDETALDAEKISDIANTRRLSL